MVDVAWQGLPNWIVAVTSVLTLGAAVFAGIFARRAAHWTKQQAESSKDQAQIARDALAVAQNEAETAAAAIGLQEAEVQRANRRLDESRLDALAPTIFARATPGVFGDQAAVLQVHVSPSIPRAEFSWRNVVSRHELANGEHAAYRTNVTITFSNVSERLALIDIVDPVGGELDIRQGTSLVIPPHDERVVVWTRVISSMGLSDDAGVNRPENWLFNLRFWARDLGMNVRDAYAFNGDLRFFERDGTRLIVATELPFPWTENVAVPLPDRVYERLDAGQVEPTL